MGGETMIEWKTVKIGDCLSTVIDNRGKTPKELSLCGHPLLEINVVSNSQKFPVYSETKKYVSENIYKTWFRSGHPQIGDILVPTVGTLGAVSYMDRNDCCIAQNLIALRTNESICNSGFLYYQLCNSETRQRLLNLDIGAVQASIKVPHLKELEISIPSLQDQRRIAAILSSLDAQIENNNRINRNLEEQAQALFKSWFVDFEPWGGKMPEEWKEGKLGDYCNCLLGGTPSRAKSEFWNGDVAWINSGEVNRFRITSPSEMITKLGLEKSATKLLPAKTTVLAITGATLGQVSLLEIDSCANQSVIGILQNEMMPYEFIYPLMNEKIKELVLHQTGGAQQHINKDNVESVTFIVPDRDTMQRYKKVVSPIFATIANNEFESARLATLRDTLLPKLMKGEIEI